MNATCDTIRQLLSEQRDRTLTTNEQTTLRTHLTTCPDCRAFDRGLLTGMAGVARLPRVSGSAHVREAVLAEVHPGGRSAWPRGWREWTGQTLKIGGAVTAFVLVAVLLMNVFDTTGTGEPDERLSGTGSQPGAIVEPTATPEPEPTAPTNADIYALPVCHPDQVEYEIESDTIPGGPNLNTSAFVRISVLAIKSTGGIQCSVSVPVSMEITDSDDTPLDIQGNPAIGSFDATLGAGDARIEFAWRNWCGEQGPFNISAEILTSSDSGTAMGTSLDRYPPCDDETQPSTLELISTGEEMPATANGDCRGPAMMATDIDSASGDVLIWYVTDMSTGCGNDDSGTFRLEEQAGDLLDIDGNDTAVTFRASEASEFEWIGMRWSNWCGDIDRVKLELGNDVWGFGAWIEERPTCQDASQPSQLTVLDTPPADPWPGDTDPTQATPLPGMTSEPPVCDPAALQLTLLPMPSPDFHLTIEGEAEGGSDAIFCTVEAAEISVTISDAEGQPLDIDRNGETFATEPQGAPGVVWENWCGEEGPFTIIVTISDQSLSLDVPNGPECTDDDAPSTLWGQTDMRTKGP